METKGPELVPGLNGITELRYVVVEIRGNPEVSRVAVDDRRRDLFKAQGIRDRLQDESLADGRSMSDRRYALEPPK